MLVSDIAYLIRVFRNTFVEYLAVWILCSLYDLLILVLKWNWDLVV